ncbi:hypothetical protein [Neopusillimonas aromaticivorans]|uniref:hypothetical protein n=1 Tax=Neopusillimonas aromaticivorans TaxID=2979868 RepID=UPI002598CAD2|nr:hypothetical protein [Neopusillimonas aromaticivorans]WJJ94009.1 hypothetical protein N7E01_02180 [Neopusillimonas aromaticivorans]
MAGVKGRSGGARSGAGRPRKTPAAEQQSAPVQIEADSMLDMLQKVALGQVEATALQVRAAIAAVQYTHVKAGDGGKKDARKEAAAEAARGRLAPKQPRSWW